MQSFLEKIATHIHSKYPGQLSDICIILPNRRAKLFLKNHLAKQISQPIWMPEILSIEDFVQKIAGSRILTPTGLLFRFYEVYIEIEKENAASFDEFSAWAPTLLHDFNETDSYLADASSLFTYLNETRAIDTWNPSGTPPSDFQKKYLQFFHSLGIYYKALTENLLLNNLAYTGMAYRQAAEATEEKIKKQNWKKILFAGFNALNTAEERIITSLVNAGKAEVLWDADIYYTRNHEQEAGKFLRSFKYEQKLFKGEMLWEENNFLNGSKNIEIIGVPQNVGQAKLAGNLLSTIHKSDPELTHTALVLADENLLVPALNSIPEDILAVNVTMGYSLKNVPLFNLADIVFSLHENVKVQTNGQLLFYYRNVLKFIRHPYITTLLGNTEQGLPVSRILSKHIASDNKVYISFHYLQELCNRTSEGCFEKIALVFENTAGENTRLLYILETLISRLDSHFKNNGKKNILEQEYCYQFNLVLKQLGTLLATHNLRIEIKTLHALFVQAIRSQTLSFYGEPLTGLQVMGMLETRTLDFETVILLSANEDILPSGKKDNSFIPYEIKKHFGLPTYSDKDAIFAYHFYRLLQRAKTIYLLYNTETDELGSGEKSRFLTQLIQELPLLNPEIKITERIFSLPLSMPEENEIIVQKDRVIRERLKRLTEEGFSPSRLNTYRNCSLQFYYQHIVRLRETEEVEEAVDAATFGNVVHQVLEEFYRPYLNVPLTKDILSAMQSIIGTQALLAFKKHYKSGDIQSGRNLLSFSVVKKIIHDFLVQEINELEAMNAVNKHITVVKLEEELIGSLEVAGIPVKLTGKADRIDAVTGAVRIIDYKTGAVDAKELKLESIGDLENNPILNKSFQLLMYAYLYKKQNGLAKTSLYPGIISFRSLRSGLKKLSINNNDGNVGEEFLLEFETYLAGLLTEILNPEIPFVQTTDTRICSYCPYKDLCNR